MAQRKSAMACVEALAARIEEGKNLGEPVTSHFLKPDVRAPPHQLLSASACLRMRADDFALCWQLTDVPVMQMMQLYPTFIGCAIDPRFPVVCAKTRVPAHFLSCGSDSECLS